MREQGSLPPHWLLQPNSAWNDCLVAEHTLGAQEPEFLMSALQVVLGDPTVWVGEREGSSLRLPDSEEISVSFRCWRRPTVVRAEPVT